VNTSSTTPAASAMVASGGGQSIKASGIAARTGRTQTCNRHDSPKPKTPLTRGGRPHNRPPGESLRTIGSGECCSLPSVPDDRQHNSAGQCRRDPETSSTPVLKRALRPPAVHGRRPFTISPGIIGHSEGGGTHKGSGDWAKAARSCLTDRAARFGGIGR
jgi:hypothetical protein